MKVLTIDLSNLLMRSLFSNMPSPTEKRFDLFKAVFMTSFFKIISENSPNMVICAMDDSSWRKDIFPGYKASRAAKRSASVIDFDAFFSVWETMLKQLKTAFEPTNIKFVKIPKLEADDIIAITTKYHPDWQIINVSSDRDYLQLYKYSHYSQWEPIKKEFLSTLSPENALLLKVICGDRSDDIPGIMRGVGVKRAEKILESGTLQEWLNDNNLNEAFNMNMRLVSFDHIPQEYVELIKTEIDNLTHIEQPMARKFSDYVMNSGLAILSEHLTEYVDIIKNIK